MPSPPPTPDRFRYERPASRQIPEQRPGRVAELAIDFAIAAGQQKQEHVARQVVHAVLQHIGNLDVGPPVIFGLTIAIFLGIFVGTYSSIYISSPVLVWLGVQPDSFLRSDEKDDSPEAQPA